LRWRGAAALARAHFKRIGRGLAMLGLLFAPMAMPAQDSQRSPQAQRPIEERIEDLQGEAQTRTRAAGDEALIVLRPIPLFTAQAFSSYRFTNNAFLSNELRADDRVLEQSASLTAATRIAERLDASMTLGVFSGRYAEHSELDYDGFYGELSAALPLDAASSLTFSYAPAIAFDRGFDRRSLTLHKFRLRLERSYLVAGRVGLYPFLSVARTFADPEDFRHSRGRAGVDVAYTVSARLYAFGTLEGVYTRYDDYFEAFTREARRDTSVQITAGLSWSPRPWATLYLTLNATRLWSSVRVNTYDELSVTPSLSLYARF
jgi:hypothetical protein